MVRTQIQLTETQAKTLKRVAVNEGISVAEIIRRAVENMLQAGHKAGRQERVKRAVEIAGKFRSGKGNVSRKHDEYLAEVYGK